ncbi:MULTISPECIES: hypothetical protein [unclassified Kitasatospora]|uniref:hypothetical protein n=1 Tax=unclassified Kitasatospora TaxID=2633591 RepID=UPI00070C3F92|nr:MULTISPECIES: hypothetical protein [unclassified Kitasatospora]
MESTTPYRVLVGTEDALAAGVAPIGAVRLLAHLPPRWRTVHRAPATGLLELTGYAPSLTALRAEVARALADPALRTWRLAER